MSPIRSHLFALPLAAALAGCVNGAEPEAPASSIQSALTTPQQQPKRGAILAELHKLPAHPAQAELVFEGRWGSETGQLGRTLEASTPGPMRITTDSKGRLYVLDQVNQRVQVFDHRGALLKQIGPVPVTSEDLVVTGERLWIVAQPGPGPDRRLRLVELDHDGRRLQHGYIRQGAVLLTGLFAAGDESSPDIWLELRHRHQVRVVEEGRLLSTTEQHATRNQALGRPTLTASPLRLAAARTGKMRASVVTVDGTGKLTPVLDLVSDEPIVHLLELGSDARGNVFFAFATDRGQGALFDRKMVIKPASGQPQVIDLVDGLMASDAFRTVAIGADGTVYQLQTSAEGAKIWRWRADR